MKPTTGNMMADSDDGNAGILTVPDKLPTVRITAPVDGQQFVPGQLVTFEGNAFDADDGPLGDASLPWSPISAAPWASDRCST
jgi:hypothetical protein